MTLLEKFRRFIDGGDYSSIKDLFPQFKNTSLVFLSGAVGKSCISYKLSKVLKASAVSFGSLQSNPYGSIREGIKINDEKLSDDKWLEYLNKTLKLLKEKKISITREKLLLFMGFMVFHEKGITLCILEDHPSLDLRILKLFQTVSVIQIRDPVKKKNFYSRISSNISLWILSAEVKNPKFLNKLKRKNASVRYGLSMGGGYDDENIDLSSMMLKMLARQFPISDTTICEHIRERPKGCFEVIPQIVFKQWGWKKAFQWVILDKPSNPKSFHNVLETVYTRLPSMKRWVLLEVNHHQNLEEYLNKIDAYSQYLVFVSKEAIQEGYLRLLTIPYYQFQTVEEAFAFLQAQESIEEELMIGLGQDSFIHAFEHHMQKKQPIKKDPLEEMFLLN